MPRFAFNVFTGTLDIVGAIADVVDGVLLAENDDYLLMEDDTYLAFE